MLRLSVFLSLVFFCALGCFAQSKPSDHICEYACVTHDSTEYHFAGKHTPFKGLAFKQGAFNHFIGSTHQHSGFSDGKPKTRPETYYQSGKDKGFDFVFGTEHSDNYNIPVGLHNDCFSANLLDCITFNPLDPVGSFMKWPATAEMAASVSEVDKFLAVRGFEWTSDRFGHINVYFSKNITNAKTDGGYVLMPTFWSWLTTSPIEFPLISGLVSGYGGADALCVFNHPGDKKISDQDPGYNWNNFEYVPKADSQMVGIEVYNNGKDYAADGRSFYQEALDKGWHVGAIAAEDHHEDNWNNDTDEKTVFIADNLSEASVKGAMRNRRFYAVRDQGLRMNFSAGKAIMGAQIQRKTGSLVGLSIEVNSRNVSYLELVSTGGIVVLTKAGTLIDTIVEVSDVEKWYYIRAVNSEGKTMAYSSPIWIKGGGDEVDNIDVTSVKESNSWRASLSEPYPNPVVNGSVYLNAGEEQLIKWQLKNALGQCLVFGEKSLQLGENELFSISDLTLAQGLYVLVIRSEKGVQDMKIQVE